MPLIRGGEPGCVRMVTLFAPLVFGSVPFVTVSAPALAALESLPGVLGSVALRSAEMLRAGVDDFSFAITFAFGNGLVDGVLGVAGA